MKTREEVLKFGLSFKNVYEDEWITDSFTKEMIMAVCLVV